MTEHQSPPHTHFSARAAETALLGQAGALQCGKSAGAASLGTKNSTSQMTPLCFEDICGVRIKHLSPPECTEGANLCPTAPMTSGFSSAPRDHSLKLSLSAFSPAPKESSGSRLASFVEPQLSKYPNTDAGRCQPSLPQLQPADANAATAPQAGQEAADTAVLNTNSLLTWQTKRLLHSPPGRSITEQSPTQAEPAVLQAGISSSRLALLPCSP